MVISIKCQCPQIVQIHGVGFFFLKLTYTCSCLCFKNQTLEVQKKILFLFILSIRILYNCTHQTGELTLLFITCIMINLHTCTRVFNNSFFFFFFFYMKIVPKIGKDLVVLNTLMVNRFSCILSNLGIYHKTVI